MRQRIRKGIILFTFLLLPAIFYYFSPYLIIMGASEGIISGSSIVFGVLFLSALFLGRGFCAWFCPLAGIQEASSLARDKNVSNRYNWIRYIIWVPWIAIIIYMAITAGGFKRVLFTYQTTFGFSISDVYGLFIYLIVVITTIILSFAVGKRALCHYVCWISPFMIGGRKLRNLFKWPSLRLVVDKDKCVDCLTCTKNCPMSLDVNLMVKSSKMENSECILCGTCVDNCKKGVIKYSFSKGI
ncbi:MAG: 4Fe-4S ferredoxin [Actinobacteria bacterium RBG_19FT_COMBO_36_27]|nr:MAG: 4Fe-4S ferredoxin [Actinobacteria bacterium RBG_19FT_COMBO_36_27]